MSHLQFKNASGTRYLNGLFYEMTNDKSTCVYTLKNEDHKGYASLYRLYMEANDPTEYSFAVSNLDGWDHWEALQNCSWFKPYLHKWRRELDIRFKSIAIANIISVSKSQSKDAMQANKFLATRGYIDKDSKGRPSKDDIKKAAEDQAELERQLTDDMERVSPGRFN